MEPQVPIKHPNQFTVLGSIKMLRLMLPEKVNLESDQKRIHHFGKH